MRAGERIFVTFRAEAYNLLNWVNFNAAARTRGSAKIVGSTTRLVVFERQTVMLRFLRFASIIPLAFGSVYAQEASNIFEKAPPDVDEGLRARITQFYQAFVNGKFRQADAFVAEDSKDVFFAMEKKQYKACELGTITYSDNFTKARAVTSCDTKYFMLGREIAVKLPITSEWRLQDGAWYWYVIPISERTTINTPIGPVKVPPAVKPGEEPLAAGPAPIQRPDPMVLLSQMKQAVKVDRDSITINPTKASTEEIHVKNSMPGTVSLTADLGGIAGLSIKPAKADIGAGEDAKLTLTFDPEDPAITCSECLSHPQSRSGGKITLRVDQTGQTFTIDVHYLTPAPGK